MRRSIAPESALQQQHQRASNVDATYRLTTDRDGELTIHVGGVACADLAQADAELARLEAAQVTPC